MSDPIRESFVETFDEAAAVAVEKAARSHANEGNSTDKGTSPFRWACLICIGYQCCENISYRESHRIFFYFDSFTQWCREYGDLGNHEGDYDIVTALSGGYDKFIAEPAPAPAAQPVEARR